MATTHGVVQIHSAPSALCPHIEWAVGGAIGVPIHLTWLSQPAERASYRAEYAWTGPVGTSAKLTSALKGWQRLRFEVTERATPSSEAVRYSYTPALGLFHATVGLHGDVMINEQRLKAAVVREALGGRSLHEAVNDLLGTAWDDELEVGPYGEFNKTYLWLRTQKGLLGSETKALTEVEINEGIKARSNAIGDLYECAVFDDDGIAFAARAFTIVK